MITHFSEMIVWQRAMDLVVETYMLARKLPREERYALSEQMRRAAISIPSNIAEGQSRHTTREFVRFLSMAKGSNAELHTQLLICARIRFLSPADIQKALSLSNEIGKMLNSLIQKLSDNEQKLTNH